MREDHQKDLVQGGQWAEQQKKGLKKQAEAEKHNQQKAQNDPNRQQQGDERTPDQPIGQVAYADGQKQQLSGGAGEPETSRLEPEKQGGIGGP